MSLAFSKKCWLHFLRKMWLVFFKENDSCNHVISKENVLYNLNEKVCNLGKSFTENVSCIVQEKYCLYFQRKKVPCISQGKFLYFQRKIFLVFSKENVYCICQGKCLLYFQREMLLVFWKENILCIFKAVSCWNFFPQWGWKF